tara:strand:- start:1664 stop:2506 length:843 start_codon:yes stop_codon:yes gene_type:complete
VKKEIIWSLSLKKTEEAIESKSLIPFDTKLDILECNNYNYELRILIDKPTNKDNKEGPKQNPFKPWDKDLEISKVLETHVLILNKYPVEIGHMLLITKDWMPQNGWLDYKDWEALVEVSQDTSGLWFFNNSEKAGASQPHRHLQLLRRPEDNFVCPRQKWFEDFIIGKFSSNYNLNKSCLVYPRQNINSAQELNDIYLRLCKEMDIGDPLNNNVPKKSYNLLITNNWFALITRSQESFKGFSINGLGFAGYFLVTTKSDLDWLKVHSPESLLSSVVMPLD